MQEFTTQFIVKNKSEALNSDDTLEYTLNINPTTEGVSGELRINVSDPAINEFFGTGEVFDVVLTPRSTSA